MQTLVRYGLAFGAGFGIAKVFQWTPVSSDHRHGDATPGAKMTAKGSDHPFTSLFPLQSTMISGHLLDMGARIAVRVSHTMSRSEWMFICRVTSPQSKPFISTCAVYTSTLV